MRVIRKYSLLRYVHNNLTHEDSTDDIIIDLPPGHIFMKFADQNGYLYIWTENDEEQELVPHTFRIFGDSSLGGGTPIPEGYIYLASTQSDQSMWHLHRRVD